ncbi:N-acetyltransferase [Pilimelia anulata]|uniref:N-acetyltransferase n=1 Tax=Pilimelia anulata TaxID=53371 RepID=A0A8J3F7F2_9ACTN|nr:GNAT family N-acetyltransferase [Pilimelia anulata]GGJ76094.1 N-acetyltransferase [Pilimelia anulata]
MTARAADPDPVRIRPAGPADAAALHRLAALTFPLACPPRCAPAAIAAFVVAHLGVDSFARYLADPARDLLLAEAGGAPAGYTMLVHGEPADPDVVAALTARPTTELSKCYVHPDHIGGGVAAALVGESLAAARRRGSAAVWLGVNRENARANRFYDKCGFAVVGHKRFRVGDEIEDDFVRELVLPPGTP